LPALSPPIPLADMARRIHWSDLRTGLIVLAAVVALAASILIFARVGALHGDTSTLFVAVDDASGILPGTDVWLSGKKVGLVVDVHIRPVTSDLKHRLAIHTKILTKTLPLIRKDSRVDIRPGGNLIGTPVVYLKVGTLRFPPVKDGDTIFERPHGKLKPVIDQVTAVAADLGRLTDSTTRMLALFDNPANAMGSFRHKGAPQLRSASAAMSKLGNQARSGSGTLGLASRGHVGTRISRLFAQRDSIRLLLAEGHGAVGRFRRDSTLSQTIAHLRGEADTLRALLNNPRSPASRMRSDTALTREMDRARMQLDSLMAAVKKHPLKYIRP